MKIPPMNIHPLNLRRGKFHVSHDLVREHPDELMRLLSCCLVVRCESDYATGSLEYTALSEHFDEVNPKFGTPEYRCLLEQVNIGTEEKPEYETRLQGFRKHLDTPTH